LPNRRAARALNAHRRGVKLLLFDSKTFSSKKKKKFLRAFFVPFFARAKKGKKKHFLILAFSYLTTIEK